MANITKMQYEYALERIEDLLPVVDDTDPTSEDAIQLSIYSDLVAEYESEHYPIDIPTPGELISEALKEKSMTQRQLASEVGVSPSRISDYVTGRAEPTLRIAGKLCSVLGLSPAAMMGFV